jgi:oligoribonuclease
MTGLEPDSQKIIEIATIVTDKDLNILEEGPMMAIHQPKSLMDAMDDWCTQHHGDSGLTKRVAETNVTESEAEQATIEFLQKWVAPGQSPMCGNSVGQDRRFMVRYMPELSDYFHYRNIDVSTLKELAVRWKPQILHGFSKQNKHLALDDIRESIEELAYYREHFIDL